MAETLKATPAEPQSREDAQKEINKIRRRYRVLNEEDDAELQKTSKEFRESYYEDAAETRDNLAALTRTAATQLYISRFRFIYELIQNADDTSYSKCLKEKQNPTLKFILLPDSIVVESNEDGFRLEDVRSICRLARSSKTDDPNTIGAKGLGFKSVFAISRRVTIHSGVWSFEFKNSGGDNGLGMIVPHWIDRQTTQPQTRTKITLYLNQKSENFMSALTAAFKDVPDTTLLFLRKIENLTISFQHNKNGRGMHEYKRHRPWTTNERAISTATIDHEEVSLYRMRRNEFQVAPHGQVDDDVQYETESTCVELAFPLDGVTKQPSISKRGQHVFAFLPMKRMAQLPFIIQADFNTTASREAPTEDIRNRQLRDAVSTVFVEAVEEFCTQGDLKYSWTRYVPSDQLEDFWMTLHQDIRQKVSSKALIKAKDWGFLRRISEMRIVPLMFRHENEPLLDGTDFIDDGYDEDALRILKTLGLKDLCETEMLDLVQRDTERVILSRIKSKPFNDAWHTSFLDFLLEYICEPPEFKRRLASLPLLPVLSKSGLSWRACHDKRTPPVYLPQLDDSENAPSIDPELGLSIIDPNACHLRERRAFYQHWGVEHVRAAVVISAVMACNETKKSQTSQYVEHFAILFWCDANLSTHPRLRNRMLWGIDQRGKECKAVRLYFHSEEPYSTSRLLQRHISHQDYGFLNEEYLENKVKHHISANGTTWRSWLKNVAGIRTYPSLIGHSPTLLSPLFLEIVQRAPSKVVNTLRAHWQEYKEELKQWPNLRGALKDTQVLCRNGDKRSLDETILPTDSTLTAGESFGVQDQLPYLQLDAQAEGVTVSEWSFLLEFGVCLDTTLHFHLDSLDILSRKVVSGGSLDIMANAVALYKGIRSVVTMEQKVELQSNFKVYALIFVSQKWWDSYSCVWSGPDFLTQKVVLSKEYGSYEFAQEFFTDLLEIEDATHDDILEELERLKDQQLVSEVSIARMATIYKELNKVVKWREMTVKMREKFETEALIFDGQDWVTLSSCIWSSAVVIRGRAILNKLYPDLSNFFVDRLGIKAMSTVMALEELIRMSDEGVAEPGDFKYLLRELSSMLSNDDTIDKVDDLLKRLKQCRFLPLAADSPNDNPFLVSIKDKFLIVDEQRLGDAFSGKTRLLDFLPQELALLHPLFAALRLENRYLSRNVRVETAVEHCTLDDRLTRDMRKRSFAISCCTLSHKWSFDQAELLQKYQQLLNCEVHVSASMKTTLSLDSDHLSVQVESEMVSARISESDGRITIVVPKDDTQRQRCYRTHLPGQLLRFAGVVTQSAEKQMYRILNESLSTLDNILREENIPIASQLQRSVEQDGEVLEEDMASLRLLEQPQARNTIDVAVFDRPADADPIQHRLANTPDSYSPDGYRKVLENVLQQARAVDGRRLAGLATSTPPNRADLGVIVGWHKSTPIFQRIGAAGELFVFTRLNALLANSPLARPPYAGLSLLNWRSSIRHLVDVLPEYEDIERYEQAEVADIMYTDVDGGLELLLRQKAFNGFPAWPERTSNDDYIQFYIEVKTTIGGCDERFFMSKNQYRLLSNHALVEGQRPKVVYVIARVYELLSTKIGVEFFVDPKTLEGNLLDFEFGASIVVPRTGGQTRHSVL